MKSENRFSIIARKDEKVLYFIHIRIYKKNIFFSFGSNPMNRINKKFNRLLESVKLLDAISLMAEMCE